MEVLFLHQYQADIAKLSQILPYDFAVNSTETRNYDVVIRWGNVTKIAPPGEEINSKEAIIKARNTRQAIAILSQNGIRCPKAFYTAKPKEKSMKTASGYIILQKPFVRRYRVHVFDTKVLGMTKHTTKGQVELPMKNPYHNAPEFHVQWGEKEWDKVCSVAARSIYYLGLIFGAVEVGVEGSGRVVVYNVESAPPLTEYLIEVYAAAFKGYLSGRSDSSRVTLGADPEFMLRNRLTKGMVWASSFFPQKGLVGCDQRSVSGQKRRFPLAELRPNPEHDPIMLFENLRIAMQTAIQLAPYNNVEWVAGSEPFDGYQIGGHIHFGNCQPSITFLRALDNYLAIPLMLVENPASARKRRNRYGFLGDFRFEHYGGFEYRTLSCWLVSPRIAKAVLCLAYLIAINHQNLNKNFLASSSLCRDFYYAKKETFYHIFEVLWEDICRLPQYTNYQQELSCIEEMIKERKRWRETLDIRKSWRLPVPKAVYYEQ